MRHRKRTAKLGRKSEHRNLMLANLVCSLIKHRRVTTTLAKAKAARSVAEKMLTLGKSGSIHHRRLAAARLRQEDAVRILFNEIAPTQMDRPGGYTRIIKLHERKGDAAQLAILEWVDETLATPDKEIDTTTKDASVSEPKTETPAATEGTTSEKPSESDVKSQEGNSDNQETTEGESESKTPKAE